MTLGPTLDLVMLVPGKDERETFAALLSSRHESLNIKRISYEILVHPRRDPGCFNEAPDILQPYLNLARYALVVFDYEGSGQEDRLRDDVAKDLKDRIERSGWKDRIEVLVLFPELEIWVWSDSPEVDKALGWQGRSPSLKNWLSRQGWRLQDSMKPSRPKESLDAALREVRMRRSSAVYRQIAENVSLSRCQDQVFRSFQNTLKLWFPAK